MLVEINSLDNGSGLSSKLDIYLCYNEQQKLFEPRPYCCIDEMYFADLLSNADFKHFENGTKYQFRVKKSDLQERANKIYQTH